ncbi:MAG: acyltransferase family protein [Candidatus Schekmanbacteria bacterium]|nr:acyltransferase family protein [Candidatus Schekmanbacteria bacterium]
MAMRIYQSGDEHNIDAGPAELDARSLAICEWLERYFRYEVFGLENVPITGAGLIISPHSTVTVEAFFLGARIFRSCGRIPRGLSDHDVFRVPGMRSFFVSMGAVDGTQENGAALLARGELCFAMPGGAYEAWKPSSQKYRLFWDGHYGFVRLSLRARAPLIPTVCIGADDAYWLPVNSFVAGQRLLGIRAPLVPPLGIGLLPFPVKMTAYVGAPITLPYPPEAADDQSIVERCHSEVVMRVEQMIQDGLQRRKSVWW